MTLGRRPTASSPVRNLWPVQTRADLLQAHRFQVRRAVAALVTGRPNVAEPPIRRLTVITISAIVIAILVAVGFALFGVLRAHDSSAVENRLCFIHKAAPGFDQLL